MDSNLKIAYQSDNASETYYLNNSDGITQEIFSVKYTDNNAVLDREKHIFKNGKDIASIQVTLGLLYDVATRNINEIPCYNVSTLPSAQAVSLSNTSSDAWSHSGEFPCTQVDYAYTTTLTGFAETNDLLNGTASITLK